MSFSYLPVSPAASPVTSATPPPASTATASSDWSPRSGIRPGDGQNPRDIGDRLKFREFVFAGINVERAGLLSGARGEQIAGRFSMVRTGPFSCDEQWATLIAALEDSLRLHRPGALPEQARYLHKRTGGMIGSLLWLIRGAAIQAVLEGTEKITRTGLDSIGVDIAAETAGTTTRRPRSSP